MLVVIGLIVGGVLVGRDLIGAAAVRAQITQIEKYNTAANTFREKYDYLPGDITAASATQFGLVARAGTRGRGDGNGLVEGYNYSTNTTYPSNQGGETLFFWEDLSQANLIEQKFSKAADAGFPTLVYKNQVPLYLPPAKILSGDYVYAYSANGVNYFAIEMLEGPNSFGCAIDYNGYPWGNPSMTVAQAYAIDTKIDDGLPLAGKVQAVYIQWAVANNWSPSGVTASSSTCFDTTSKQYSITQNNGNGVNCGLSFKIQAGD